LGSKLWDRLKVLTGIGAASAITCIPDSLQAALSEDRVKVVHYYCNPGDSSGRGGQPMVNQSTNVAMIETESGLFGIGDGGWAIDFHTELDMADAINLATLLEPMHAYFLRRPDSRRRRRFIRAGARALVCRSLSASNSATSGMSTG
jgi:hypothetical protein